MDLDDLPHVGQGPALQALDHPDEKQDQVVLQDELVIEPVEVGRHAVFVVDDESVLKEVHARSQRHDYREYFLNKLVRLADEEEQQHERKRVPLPVQEHLDSFLKQFFPVEDDQVDHSVEQGNNQKAGPLVSLVAPVQIVGNHDEGVEVLNVLQHRLEVS